MRTPSYKLTVYPITHNIEVHQLPASANIYIYQSDGFQRVILSCEEIRVMANALTKIADAYEKGEK